jgi:DNA-directed RNA polymerase specialized sigma24 family protein
MRDAFDTAAESLKPLARWTGPSVERSALGAALRAAMGGRAGWSSAGRTPGEARAALVELHANYLRRAKAHPGDTGRALLEHRVGVDCLYRAWRMTTRWLQPQDQLDVLQEGILRFLQDFAAGKGPRYQEDRGLDAFSAWLYEVWRRRFLTLVIASGKSRGRTGPLTPTIREGLDAPAEPCGESEGRTRELDAGRLWAELRVVLAELGPKYDRPELWLACWRREMTWKELADACGVRPCYISRLHPKVLGRLRRRLGHCVGRP